jgi:hypothetical protein
MNDTAKGTIIGFMVAVILAGFVVAVLDFRASGNGDKADKKPPAKVTVARLGPGGKPDAFFGDDLRNVVIPGSRGYDFCFGELRVQRPSMMTTNMPAAYCSVSRHSPKGPWRISTGGWQECQAVCVKFPGK